jgi:DNA-directed RNA polymerase specialized sigma24 family protein
VADTEGFEEFYTATVGRLLGVLFPVTGDLHEAEEIVQEAYARASTRWARLRDHDAPEAWVRRVAMNLAADRGRRLQELADAATREGVTPGPAHAIRRGRRRRRRVTAGIASLVAVALAAGAAGVADRTPDRHPRSASVGCAVPRGRG